MGVFSVGFTTGFCGFSLLILESFIRIPSSLQGFAEYNKSELSEGVSASTSLSVGLVSGTNEVSAVLLRLREV
jgi:hypothetical protein